MTREIVVHVQKPRKTDEEVDSLGDLLSLRCREEVWVVLSNRGKRDLNCESGHHQKMSLEVTGAALKEMSHGETV